MYMYVYIQMDERACSYVRRSDILRKLETCRRREMICIERSVQCCTLRPKVQDEGPVCGAYKTASAAVRNSCASLL